MHEDRVGEAVVIEEVISLWAQAESGSGKRKATAGSLRQAQGRLSPDVRPVRNDKLDLGSGGRVGGFEGVAPKEVGGVGGGGVFWGGVGGGGGGVEGWGGG